MKSRVACGIRTVIWRSAITCNVYHSTFPRPTSSMALVISSSRVLPSALTEMQFPFSNTPQPLENAPPPHLSLEVYHSVDSDSMGLPHFGNRARHLGISQEFRLENAIDSCI